MSDYRDWSSLPPDLVLIILKNLPDLEDFVKFHFVCKAWHSTILQSPHPSPFLPYLVDHCYHQCCVQIHSPFADKSLSCDSAQLNGKSISGPSHGKMIMYDKTTSKLSLFSPLTWDEVTLPPLEILFGGESSFRPYLLENRELVIISAKYGTSLCFCSCRIGDKYWKVVKHPVQMEGAGNIYFQCKFYVNESLDGPTAIVDPSTGSPICSIPPPEDRNLHQEEWKNNKGTDYLVDSNGSLLRVFRPYDVFDSVENCYFDIHRLVSIEGRPRWVKIGDIGDQMLFLDKLHGISKSSDGIAGARGNCIYFTKYLHYEDLGWAGVLCRYDIGSGKAEALPCFMESRGCWVVPCLL